MAKTILIVDDSASMRQLVKISLASAGHQVIEACDGRDALNKLTGQKINLVISDVNMPNLDGIGLVKALKARNEYRFTPIMMLTTESEQAKKAEGQAAGARAWIVKPFQPQQLLAAVEKLIG
ncbi:MULTISPECIES: response regulator [Pseudomonas]|jgi:two-component system chemotaxis response regulator CheY|uniref:Two-component system chemotaxis response regulator CheY n=2 Tax=Pseudomonas TaxID=286 RepID=A0A9X8EHK1_PSEPU|nr:MULTISPECIES: response regulator [Pseudomonas]KIU51725.1 chemotaxis protein CheY [Pseudomonas putida]KTC19979.1 chemotaxis protein CheY [Pseudomonas putida]MBG8561349.1 response regulator [Pseudomonas qingdaonensis]MCO7503829.1 response regulator [Pseudomonas sp. VE 267-6A]MCO7530250.1 response regulator [Pseudomonas sp. 2]